MPDGGWLGLDEQASRAGRAGRLVRTRAHPAGDPAGSDSYTLIPVDQPGQLVGLLREFTSE